MTAHDQTGFTEVHPDPLRELRHIRVLRDKLLTLETLALRREIDRERDPEWVEMLEAAYDLTEIEAVYEAAQEVCTDEKFFELNGFSVAQGWAADQRIDDMQERGA